MYFFLDFLIKKLVHLSFVIIFAVNTFYLAKTSWENLSKMFV